VPATRRLPLTVLLTLPLVLLTACASGDGGSGNGSATGSPSAGTSSTAPSSSPAAPGGGDQGDDALQVEVNRGDGGPLERYRLACTGSAEGTLPDVAGACAHLAGLTDPFAPVAADAVCAQVYGGPQTAHVTGRWHGSAVDLQLSRIDACHTVQWDRLGPLLPGPVG
jgi:hypothetical protein